jgi:hypothetical protein
LIGATKSVLYEQVRANRNFAEFSFLDPAQAQFIRVPRATRTENFSVHQKKPAGWGKLATEAARFHELIRRFGEGNERLHEMNRSFREISRPFHEMEE